MTKQKLRVEGKTMNFLTIKDAVDAQFTKLLNTGTVLTTAVSKDAMKAMYLGSFPPGSNEIFRTRATHDCQCCLKYIALAGNAVSYIDGKLETIWDIDTGDNEYQVVADAMAKLVRSAAIDTIFLHFSKDMGVSKTPDFATDIIWDHFYTEIPNKFIRAIPKMDEAKGAAKTNYTAFNRSVTEITNVAIETVLELIEGKMLYKGNEYEDKVGRLRNMKALRAEATNKECFDWENSLKLGIKSSFHGGPIGIMLVGLSKGKELQDVVNIYHVATAPENYKHSVKPTTPRQVKAATARIIELGRQDSLERRHAVTKDITINDVLFADRSTQTTMGGVLSLIKPTATAPEVKTDNAKDISISDFLSSVVPVTTSMEVLVEGKHQVNFMSLVAPLNDGCLPITDWDNNFSWSYNGELADSSMRKNVKAAGGNTDGVFGYSIQWNTPERPYRHDLDAHIKGGGEHIYYSNAGVRHQSSGMLDVDNRSPGTKVAVENIVYIDLDNMPDGDYILSVHNYSSSTNSNGFTAEVYFEGKRLYFDYTSSMRGDEKVPVATFTKKGSQFTMVEGNPVSEVSTEVYGIKSKEFHKVNMLMASPNFWDCVDKPTGNKHWFFILDKCLNEEPVRGLFNEHLMKELQPDRRVFETLGNQLKAPYSDDQLSGLGFSISQTNSVIVKVRGELNRLYNVQFNT